MHTLRKTHGFIRVSLALLFTAFTVLWWLFNHMQRQPHMKDLSAMKPSMQHTHSKETIANTILEKTIGQDSLHENDHKTNPISTNKIVKLPYYKVAELEQSPDYEPARSMSDLIDCIEILQSSETYQMEQAIRHLWVVAADLGAPEAALDALENFIMDQNNEELSEFVLFIISDLQKVIEMENNSLGQILANEQHHDEYSPNALDHEGPDLSDNTPGISLVEQHTLSDLFQEQIDDLNDQALFAPDPMHRKVAIQTVSNFRTEANLHVLLNAADDPEPTNRYLVMQALWFAAADGIGNKDDILHLLQQSRGDDDLNVAQLAERAIMDLEQLEKQGR
jgi:hypothetical protein